MTLDSHTEGELEVVVLLPSRYQDALQPDLVTDSSVTKLIFITPVFDVTEPGALLPLNVPSEMGDAQDELEHEYTITLSRFNSVENMLNVKVTAEAPLGAIIQ